LSFAELAELREEYEKRAETAITITASGLSMIDPFLISIEAGIVRDLMILWPWRREPFDLVEFSESQNGLRMPIKGETDPRRSPFVSVF
jgi:hypothetical protein